MLKKTKISALILIGLILVIVILISSPPTKQSKNVFHVTLANPELYHDGVYSDSFDIGPGTYQFHFVPNGDSPEKMTISLSGQAISWQEDFELQGTPNKTGLSEYYTWDYSGEKTIHIFEEQKIQITIDPHQDLLGPVSVLLVKIE